ncbi:histidine kinase dimerization/phospho-acceptor domain-containing protein [Shewanella halifaxensis]|uniref:histidine kinase dimerization/phospho-acceptor domain-containing protein n=1 Tax=Shewanella halifaxensis TaxID=271098 RepID=UPI000D59C924|nr:histidine kinase dimerization/phospho-acceptor domain-containing protein [Shewanella halifaxensis]
MKSIRSQLLLWLVPSFIVIAVLAGTSLYFSEKNRLNSDLDNELNKLARAVRLTNKVAMTPRRFGGNVRSPTELAENTKRLFSDDNNTFYLQAWNEAGNTVSKSENLLANQLSKLKEQQQQSHYNSQLASGENIRLHAFTMRFGPRIGEIAVAVAMSKTEVNQQLASLTYKLIIGGLFFCFLLSFILVWVIRKTLAPIQCLSEKVAQVEAGTLHNRLDTESVPTEIISLITRLNQLLARLEKSFERERQFNNDLAHELRTPLAAIRTTSEVAMKWPEQSSTEDYRYIAQSSIQLQNTIESLLSLARIENTSTEIFIEKVNIATIVKECIALQASLIKERGITIALSLDEQYAIASHPHLLRIIMANLINNSIEYAPENSEVIIDCKCRTAILTVANVAPNFNESDLTAMFDRLWRKDSSRTGTEHVGLGLSIAHSAAKAIGLALSAELDDKQTLTMRLADA